MKEEIEITRKNYKTYIQLYERKDRIDKNSTRLENILKIIEFLLLLGIAINVGINYGLIGIGLLAVGIYTFVNPEIKSTYQKRKNKELKEIFPNIDTKIETEELIDNLIMKRIMSLRYVKSGKYIKKGEWQITIHEEKFLEYQNYLEQLNEQKEKEEKRKQQLIHKYNEIKKQMLDEYIRKPTNINCPLFVPEGELDKAKKQVKKLVKSRHNERKRIPKKTFTI